MAKKLWRKLPKYLLIYGIILSGFFVTQVKAATCTNGTIQGSYTINNSNWINFTNNFSTGNNTIYAVRINLTNSNIKNNSLWYAGTINLESTLTGNVNTNPNIVFRYGTSSNFIDISNYCTTQIKRTNYGENLDTKWEVKYTCSYTGNNTNANWLQVYIYGPNQSINIGRYNNICLQINPNETDQIMNNDNQNRDIIQQQIYEDYLSLWDKGDEIEEVVRSEVAGIREALEVTGHAEDLEDTEEWDEVNEDINDLMSQQDINGLNILQIQVETTGAQYLWWLTERMINGHTLIIINTTLATCLLYGILKMIFRR